MIYNVTGQSFEVLTAVMAETHADLRAKNAALRKALGQIVDDGHLDPEMFIMGVTALEANAA